MIAFYSPEGTALRALQPSRSAIAAIWYQAVHDGRGDWVDWVRDELASGLLVEALRLPGISETFLAVTRERRFPNRLLTDLLGLTTQDRA